MTDTPSHKLVPPQIAYRKVRTALKNGVLVRPANCSRCGSEDTKAASGRHTIQAHHHRGYDFPLDVEWLCAKCHRAETPFPLTRGPSLKTRGSKNTQSKLTEEIVSRMRELKATQGLGSSRLSKMFGVDKTTVKRALNGKYWGHVPMVTK